MTDPQPLPKLLYIEDTPEARALVRRVLARDFIVLESADPLSGLELALDVRPDLVLLDVNLPQLSGREVAARLVTLLPHTPLVALSADATDQARQRALAAGFAGYLTKPLDVDTFADQLREFLHGKRETLPDLVHYQQDFAAEVVARLVEKVQELTKTAERNAFLNEQNRRMVVLLQRRQQLLEAAARVGQLCTSILDLDQLLEVTAHTICQEYGFERAVVYLLDASGEWAVGQAGGEIIRLRVSDSPLVGAAIRQRAAQLSSPGTPPDEIALPLVVKETSLGALFVRSACAEPFTGDDLTALQSLADQVAIAINNARLLRDLHQANQELLRSKTFQAIATATGEAIHWVGNKAAPIPASAQRVREDLQQLLALVQTLLTLPAEERPTHPHGAVAREALQAFAQLFPEYTPPAELLPLGLASTFEDLAIIEQSAATILAIKEDLIGPVRLRQVKLLDVVAVLKDTLFDMGLPDGAVQTDFAAPLPAVLGDARQLAQVFNNLVKNAWEALATCPQPLIRITVRRASLSASLRPYVQVQVADNGPGISPELLEKIWVSFFTTKGDRGGTGLGLSACMAILDQMEGKISVDSHPGEGATFTVLLPAEAGEQ